MIERFDPKVRSDLGDKINEVIDAVNELQGIVLDGPDDDDDIVYDDDQPTPDYAQITAWELQSPKQVDTADGLFSDFAGFVAKHPELRLYQALAVWSGYRSLYGEETHGGLKDLFYERTKGPAR